MTLQKGGLSISVLKRVCVEYEENVVIEVGDLLFSSVRLRVDSICIYFNPWRSTRPFNFSNINVFLSGSRKLQINFLRPQGMRIE